MAFVYLLRCADDSLYCGWTIDVPKRVRPTPPARPAATRARGCPCSLAAAWEVPTHTDARRLEARIKRLTRPREARADRRRTARRCNTGAVCRTRRLGQVPPTTGRAPAFLRSLEKAMLDGVREHATTTGNTLNNLTDPERAAERAHARRDALLLTHHRTARDRGPARRVGRFRSGLLLADLADARDVDRRGRRALPRVLPAASDRRGRARAAAAPRAPM